MILSTFRAVAPYRQYFLFILIVSNTLYTILAPRLIKTDLVEGAIVPDAATRGYDPDQVVAWYDAIGPEGRRSYYTILGVLDLLFIIPSYLFWLSCHLVSSPNCPEVLAYLPSVVVIFDLMETMTHMYYCAIYDELVRKGDLPGALSLLLAKSGTQFKFIFLGLSLALSAYFSIINNWSRYSRNTNDEQGEAKATHTKTKKN